MTRTLECPGLTFGFLVSYMSADFRLFDGSAKKCQTGLAPREDSKARFQCAYSPGTHRCFLSSSD